MNPFSIIFDSFDIFFGILIPLLSLWWLWLPIVLANQVIDTYQKLKRKEYLASLKWTVLEIRLPRDPGKSPKAMEQIFTSLHGIYAPVKPRDAKWKGKVPDWFSFEIVSNQGKIFFYARTPEQYRNLIESQIYAQYPEAEIYEVPDYVNGIAEKIPNDEYDLWGADLALTKEDAFPIRTYEEFEEKGGGKDDAKRIDPVASLAELLATLHEGEHLWIQTMFRPAGEDWLKRGQETMDKLSGKGPKDSGRSLIGKTVDFIDSFIPGSGAPAGEVKEEKKPDVGAGKQDQIRAIEKSLNKLGHETGIRCLYIAQKDKFKKANIAGLVGAYKQFSTQNLNGFKLDKDSLPVASKLLDKWFRKNFIEFKKKSGLFGLYKMRMLPRKPFVLNTEELATIFHFPDVFVKSPLLPRIEAKHGEPPSNLPVM